MKCQRDVCALSVCILTFLAYSGQCREQPMYMNQFAVHILAGPKAADEIAEKHNFVNLGQIGSLRNYYLLEHPHIRKRSTTPHDESHLKLKNEPQVLWVQQQHEKRRRKRDFGADQRTLLHPYPRPDRSVGPSRLFPDPLFNEQWYLNGGAKDGLDMNVAPAWKKGFTGKGVVVSILDDGIQTNHPDLALNYDPRASADINDNDGDPMPRDNEDNKHGTRCAGEVAAVAFNSYCGVGVAYNASIGGVRMLDGTVNDAIEARALSLNPGHIDIYSASWGPEDDGQTVDGPGPLARRAFINGVSSGRRGKGSIFVWASGNGGRHTDSCNCDGYTNSIFTLSISSATQGGYKPWYLEECSSTLATTYSSGTPGRDKSVATVDMDGKLRPDHICTVDHTGTSASAPLAAGIAALALEANPSLTWRDLQYLVVLTSRPGPLEREPGWATNGANRKVSHKFGYGLMDAAAMVTLAEQWTTVPSQRICKSQEINEERAIEAAPGSALRVHVDASGCAGSPSEVRFLEHVQCRLSLRFLPRGNLRLQLTSPSGTTSTLLSERPRDAAAAALDDWPFLSVHFWGERADGRWTLQVVNAGRKPVDQRGILKKWQLIFYGTLTNPVRLRSSSESQEKSGLKTSDTNVTEATVAPPEEKDNLLSEEDGGGQRLVQNCDAHCDAQGCYGRGPTQCVACKRYKLDNTCVSRCPPRSFPNRAGVCWPCHDSCETCAGPGQDSCLTCAPAHLHVADLAICVQQCPDGYYENLEKNTCEPCEPNCASCQDRPEHCTACEHHLLLHNNSCLSTCPQFTYETEDYRCAACHASCETCSGAGEARCISCRAGLLAVAGACRPSCPDGLYAHAKRRECVRCPRGCATCSADGCLSCAKGWELGAEGRCAPRGSHRCDSAEYMDKGHCRPCHSTCETCSGSTEAQCLTCGSPLLLQSGRCQVACADGSYAEAGTCVPCLHTCDRCLSRINCTSCAQGLYLLNGECRSACPAGYYRDKAVCAKCYLSCRTCVGPRRDQCVSCPAGWQFTTGECNPECPEGFFKSLFGCQKCHHSCQSCKGEGPLQCSSCSERYMLDGGLCIECSHSQYYDPTSQLCQPCHETCHTCNGPGLLSCTSCLPPLHIDRMKNKCVPCCPSAVQKDCCSCNITTGNCQNSSSSAGKRRTSVGDNVQGKSSIEKNFAQVALTTKFLSTVIIMTVGSCLVAVIIVGILLTVLQIKSRKIKNTWDRNEGYSKLTDSEVTTSNTTAGNTECSLVEEEEENDRHLFTRT